MCPVRSVHLCVGSLSFFFNCLQQLPRGTKGRAVGRQPHRLHRLKKAQKLPQKTAVSPLTRTGFLQMRQIRLLIMENS